MNLKQTKKQSDCNAPSKNDVSQRVRFKSTNDTQTTLSFNDLGTATKITSFSDSTGILTTKLLVRWDNGSPHPLTDGVDSFDIFEKAGI